jgi:antitoxin component of RelBE/YafQ-DinJ toxin-antitoxin module
MNTTTLQVPISKNLKTDAVAVAREYGFSSLQEIIRVLLAKLAKRELVIKIIEVPIYLSKKAEKRYLNIDKDFDQGKNVYFVSSVEDLMNELKR